MSLIDDWAERHIQKALENGELDNLPGAGKPIEIEDDRHVPPELCMAYKILKNSGYLPPELEQRKQALNLVNLLEKIEEDTEEFTLKIKELQILELKMKLAGMNTSFLYGTYRNAIARLMGIDTSNGKQK